MQIYEKYITLLAALFFTAAISNVAVRSYFTEVKQRDFIFSAVLATVAGLAILYTYVVRW